MFAKVKISLRRTNVFAIVIFLLQDRYIRPKKNLEDIFLPLSYILDIDNSREWYSKIFFC